MPVENEELRGKEEVWARKFEEKDRQIEAILREIEALKQGASSPITMQQHVQSVSTSARLQQNIPNPFSGSTLINYYLPEGTNGVLQVTHRNGRLVSSERLTTGSGEVVFSSDRFSPGTWFYSLFVDGKLVDTKKMVIIR